MGRHYTLENEGPFFHLVSFKLNQLWLHYAQLYYSEEAIYEVLEVAGNFLAAFSLNPSPTPLTP
jgi:hypothetical protein